MRKYLGIATDDPRFNLKVPDAEQFDFFNPTLKTGYPTASPTNRIERRHPGLRPVS